VSEAHQAPRELEYALAQLTRRSFQVVEEKAREILREKGFTEAQIQRELTRPKRKPLEDW
jgi:hypothetical protein